MLFDENIILNPFTNLPFSVTGIGILRDDKGVSIVCKKENNDYIPIGLNDDCTGGYLRYNGEVTFTPNGQLSCSEDLYIGKTEIILVTGTKNIDLASLQQSIMFRLSGIVDLTLKRFTENKQQILSEEKMAMNTLDLLKFVFDYKFDYVKPCKDVDVKCNC
ncbi:MAG TPA: hypothetical protein PKI86_09625 [Chitinophagales bacterium]|jgi:hypothetical protein|nr:hypothetical protein [Chitinophagales bacterium]